MFVWVGVDNDCRRSSFLGVVGRTGSEGRREGEQTMLIKELHSEDAETRDRGCRGARRGLAALGGGGALLDREEAQPPLGVARNHQRRQLFVYFLQGSCLSTHTRTHPFGTHIVPYSIQNSVPCSLPLTRYLGDLFMSEHYCSNVCLMRRLTDVS